MPWRPHGRARVDLDYPQAFAICERCQFLYNRVDLRWQYDYRGARLVNLGILVCDSCLDKPQEQLRPKILSADPFPILNARPELYAIDETDWRVTQNGSTRATLDGKLRVLMGNL